MTTALRRWSAWAIAAALVAPAGCGQPPPMIKITPAGSNKDQLTFDMSDETYQAKALGETPVAREGSPNVDSSFAGGGSTQPPLEPTEIGEEVELDNGMSYTTLVAGDPEGEVAAVGMPIRVYYKGMLDDGTEFDGNFGAEPATFQLIPGGLIQGWIVGIPGMKVGERRRLTIPPDLGYGAAGRPPKIPPNSTLVFEVELVGFGG